jgi:RNA polymerase sigma factor (sigma-70 family)
VCTDCPARLASDLEGAFPDFLAHHQDLVFGMAMRLTRRTADAEDLAQETFIRAYRALQGFGQARRAELRTRGWLAAIVVNLARNRARRRTPASADLEGLADITADGRPGPEQVTTRRETERAWRARLAQLPERYRAAVELRHVSGLSYPELAEALGRPIGTVKSDVHRGVRQLRAVLEREGFEGPRVAGALIEVKR